MISPQQRKTIFWYRDYFEKNGLSPTAYLGLYRSGGGGLTLYSPYFRERIVPIQGSLTLQVEVDSIGGRAWINPQGNSLIPWFEFN